MRLLRKIPELLFKRHQQQIVAATSFASTNMIASRFSNVARYFLQNSHFIRKQQMRKLANQPWNLAADRSARAISDKRAKVDDSEAPAVVGALSVCDEGKGKGKKGKGKNGKAERSGPCGGFQKMPSPDMFMDLPVEMDLKLNVRLQEYSVSAGEGRKGGKGGKGKH